MHIRGRGANKRHQNRGVAPTRGIYPVEGRRKLSGVEPGPSTVSTSSGSGSNFQTDATLRAMSGERGREASWPGALLYRPLCVSPEAAALLYPGSPAHFVAI